MCGPAAIPIVMGVATAGMGTMQSIAGYQQQQAQYQYEQQVANTQYQYQMQAYKTSQDAYQQQIEANAKAADRAYQQEQLKLRSEYAKATQSAQQLLIGKLKTQGTLLAAGRTGKSIELLASDAEREYGKDLANLGTNLGYAVEDYTFSTIDIEAQAKSANAQAASQRMVEPLKPMAGPKPGKAGMILGIGQSILSGVSTGMSLSAPKGFTGGSNAGKDSLRQFNQAAKAYG